MQEFLDYGIRVTQVLVSYDLDDPGEEMQRKLSRVYSEQAAELRFIPELLELRAIAPEKKIFNFHSTIRSQPTFDPAKVLCFSLKRYMDSCVAPMLILLASPLFIISAFLVLVDIGSPAFVWQLCRGLNGRTFQLHKFRTLKPSFDSRGLRTPNDSRTSTIGDRCRLDELGQLLNVLVGDMSLVGPKPLLPEDQPADPTVRLSVRPGITGWAQVNGGKLLDAETKNKLDERYARNAPFWLDINIIFMTVVVIIKAEGPDIDFSSISGRRQAREAVGQCGPEKRTHVIIPAE